MLSLLFNHPGDPRHVLELRERPLPEPPRGHVLVRMIASPVNPSDLIFITGMYGIKPVLPAVPGFEGVGVVERSGGGVLGWLRKGKRVAVINDRTGNWQEYTTVPAHRVYPVPADIPDEQAACYFVNPATVLAMSEHVLKVPRGGWLLQSAAGSALGRMMIRFGKHVGFRTINIVRRPEAVDELKKLGGDEVICAEGDVITERVLQLTDGRGVRFAIDPVGGATGSAVIASLADGGHALLYGVLSGEPVCVAPRFLLAGSKRVEGFLLSDWAKKQNVFTLLKVFRRIGKLIHDGVLSTPRPRVFGIQDYKTAIEMAMTGAKDTKVILGFTPIGTSPGNG